MGRENHIKNRSVHEAANSGDNSNFLKLQLDAPETRMAVIGSDDDDLFFFSGELTTVNFVLINPYSGASITIAGVKNITNDSYFGNGGTDILLLTDEGDYLSIVDDMDIQTVKDIEYIYGASGADVINFAHMNYMMGDMLVVGEGGDDLIWMNIGNDEVYGGEGNDILDGGLGNDYLYGDEDNDFIYGGSGQDHIFGGADTDVLSGDQDDDYLYYSTDNVWPSGFVAWNVGSPDDIINGEMIAVNPRYRSYDVFDGGTGTDTLIMSEGSDALFLDDMYSPNGIGANTARLISVEIINAQGGDDIVDLTSMQFSYGDVRIDGGDGNDVLWSNAGDDWISGGNGNDNIDGASGDDQLYGGEGNDRLHGRSGDDRLYGENGTDILYGGHGHDVLAGGGGNDTLTGGSSQDVFVLERNGGQDVITDFSLAEGDTININNMLVGYDPLQDAIDDFIHVTYTNGNTQISVNDDGDAGGAFTTFATLQGVNLDLTTMLGNGSLIVTDAHNQQIV